MIKHNFGIRLVNLQRQPGGPSGSANLPKSFAMHRQTVLTQEDILAQLSPRWDKFHATHHYRVIEYPLVCVDAQLAGETIVTRKPRSTVEHQEMSQTKIDSRWFLHLLQDDSGQDLIEYALLAGLITLGAIAAMKSLTTKVATMLTNAAAAI